MTGATLGLSYGLTRTTFCQDMAARKLVPLSKKRHRGDRAGVVSFKNWITMYISLHGHIYCGALGRSRHQISCPKRVHSDKIIVIQWVKMNHNGCYVLKIRLKVQWGSQSLELNSCYSNIHKEQLPDYPWHIIDTLYFKCGHHQYTLRWINQRKGKNMKYSIITKKWQFPNC